MQKTGTYYDNFFGDIVIDIVNIDIVNSDRAISTSGASVKTEIKRVLCNTSIKGNSHVGYVIK